jgi:hypothetical protein
MSGRRSEQKKRHDHRGERFHVCPFNSVPSAGLERDSDAEPRAGSFPAAREEVWLELASLGHHKSAINHQRVSGDEGSRILTQHL